MFIQRRELLPAPCTFCTRSCRSQNLPSPEFYSSNHLGQAKDVGNVIRITANFAKGWDLSFKNLSADTSVGVHGDGSCGGANVSNKVWVAGCAICAGARVQKKDV